MKKLFLISSLMVALFSGCAAEMNADDELEAEAAAAEQVEIDEQDVTQVAPVDFGTVIEAGPGTKALWKICKHPTPRCCDEIDRLPNGTPLCAPNGCTVPGGICK